MNGEMHEDFLSEIIFISLQNFAFLLVISLRKKSICRQRRISLRLFNFLLIEENYIHFSSELSSSKNFTFTLLGLTISAQIGTISLFGRELVQPSSDQHLWVYRFFLSSPTLGKESLTVCTHIENLKGPSSNYKCDEKPISLGQLVRTHHKFYFER